MTTLQVRIDEKTKGSAKKVFDKLGLDFSSAIKVFLNQVIMRQGIPFELLTENGLTPAQEERILKASAEARRGKNVTKPMNGKEALEYLRKL